MKVLIAEDVPQTRQKLVELLPATEEFEVVGHADRARRLTLDISLPDGRGVEVLKQIRRHRWELL